MDYFVEFISNVEYQLEQLEHLHSEIPPAAPWLITHTSDSHHIPSQNKTKSKLHIKKIGKNRNLVILQETLHTTHLLKLLGKMYKYEMDPTRTVGATEQICDVGRMDGRTEWNQYTPNNFVVRGVYWTDYFVEIYDYCLRRGFASTLQIGNGIRYMGNGLELNSTGAETGLFCDNKVNIMAADALTPCIIRTSAAIVLTVQDKQNLVFHEEGFQLPILSPCWEMKKIQIHNFVFSEKFSTIMIGNKPYSKYLRVHYTSMHYLAEQGIKCTFIKTYDDENANTFLCFLGKVLHNKC